MTTRYYKLPGSNEYVTWDYLHNTLGYSTSATETVGYKSVVNWGTGAGTGYCTDTTDYEAEWFVQGETGWAGLNGLAWGYNVYPSSATDIKVERSGTESNAASMTFDNVEYWLVESEIGDAWWPRSRWEQQGWAIVEEHTYDFILVDSTTGRITYGVENLTEIEFTPTGYFTIDEGNEVVFVEQSPFPVVCIDEGTRTPESIAPDASFDTELPYYDTKLYIVTTDDGQDETLYGWEAEEGTPAPAVVLPEVSLLDTLGLDSAITLYSESVTSGLRKWNGSGYAGTYTAYSDNRVYAVREYDTDAGFWGNPVGIIEPVSVTVDSSDVIGAKNVSLSSTAFRAMKVASCSDSTATVVAVHDSQNTAYNAFKFTADGTDYYYVLDNTQTDWTDDLSSIGYHIPLPTVTLDAGWVSIYPNHSDFPPNELREGRIWGSGGWVVSTYDPTKSYATSWWHTDVTGGNLQGYYGVIISDYNGRLGITNVLSYTMTRFVEAHYATCDSPDATAVPVYNSSDVAYTAFKYTRGGVDYYYVLDDVQSDWTDDLSSIGYHV